MSHFLSTVPKKEMEASKIEVSQSTFLWEACIVWVTYTQHIHIEKKSCLLQGFPLVCQLLLLFIIISDSSNPSYKNEFERPHKKCIKVVLPAPILHNKLSNGQFVQFGKKSKIRTVRVHHLRSFSERLPSFIAKDIPWESKKLWAPLLTIR